MYYPRFLLRNLITAVVLTCIGPMVASACTTPANVAALRAEIISMVNAQRSKSGLAKVSGNAKLQSAAQGLACDNAAQGKFSHVGRNGSDLRARMRGAGYRFRSANENVGRFDSAARAVQWWMGSSAHRANILQGNVRDIGVGVAVGAGNRIYWVTVKGASR